MQTVTSTLPIVHLNVHKTTNRNIKSDPKYSTLEHTKSSPCRNILLPSNKQNLKPLLGGPYRTSIKQQSLSDEAKLGNKGTLGQRVMSAKMLRFKQLQNQLADAHYHLNELANENRLLKALQKRQDSALKRYEGTNAELPRIINSHHEELRVLQTKYKKLKQLQKDTSNLLKERENELHSVNSQNKHLLQLSKDRNLEEREKLQLQISDMNHKIQQQQENIQVLHRKLTLETKSLKHQLHVEISKHKDTQKNLQETIQKLKSLECLLDNKEKRLYYNRQLPIYNKEKNLGTHSLTNLRDVSISNPVKISSRNKKYENNISNDNLPLLETLESNNDEKTIQAVNNIQLDHSVDQLKSETMASLQQIRKFRLQRCPHIYKNAHSMDDLRLRFKELNMNTRDNGKITLQQNTSTDCKTGSEKNSLDNFPNNELKKLLRRAKDFNSEKLQKDLKVKLDYSSEDLESENASEHHIECCLTDSAQTSRELYARLISSTDDTSDTLDDVLKKVDIHFNNEEKKLKRCQIKNSPFLKHKYKNKVKMLQHHRKKNFYDSGSEVDSEEKIYANREYSSTGCKSNDFQSNAFTFSKEELSPSLHNDIHSEYSTSELKEQLVMGKLKNVELQRISNEDILNDTYTQNIEIVQQASNFIENEKHNSYVNIVSKDYVQEGETRYSETEPVHSDKCYKTHQDNKNEQNNVHEEIERLLNPEKDYIETNWQSTHEDNEVALKIKLIESKETECIITEDSKAGSMENKSIIDNFNEDIHTYSMHEEYCKPKKREISNVIYSNDVKMMLNKNDLKESTEPENKNASLKAEIFDTLSNNVYVPYQTEQDDINKEITDVKQINNKKKPINYNKEKLLATMKAIDDNENIEFLNQEFRNHNITNRMQITENLFRGLPTHSKTKRDVIKDIFEDNHIENKSRSTCSKSH